MRRPNWAMPGAEDFAWVANRLSTYSFQQDSVPASHFLTAECCASPHWDCPMTPLQRYALWATEHFHELRVDLPGMQEDIEQTKAYWRDNDLPWRRLVKEVSTHIHQEQVMMNVRNWHQRIWKIFHKYGYELAPPPDASHQGGAAAHYACGCGRAFTTIQGLVSHKRLQHGHVAPERRYIVGGSVVCPICLKYLWTRQRLYQHLSYMPKNGSPNPCFAVLEQGETFFCAQPQDVNDSSNEEAQFHTGMNRIDALQAEGPSIPRTLFLGSQLQELQEEIEEKQRCLDQAFAELTPEIADHYDHLLCCMTDAWFVAVGSRGADSHQLEESWIELFPQSPELSGDAQQLIFLLWGERRLQDMQDKWHHGTTEQLAEDAYLALVRDMPTRMARLRTRLDTLKRRYDWLLHGNVGGTKPHRPVQNTENPGLRNQGGRWNPSVTSTYFQQPNCAEKLRQSTFCKFGLDKATALFEEANGRRSFVVVHLFSGRRRKGDFHDYCSKSRRLWALTLRC